MYLNWFSENLISLIFLYEYLKKILYYLVEVKLFQADFQAIPFICFITNYEILLYQFIFRNKTTDTQKRPRLLIIIRTNLINSKK